MHAQAADYVLFPVSSNPQRMLVKLNLTFTGVAVFFQADMSVQKWQYSG